MVLKVSYGSFYLNSQKIANDIIASTGLQRPKQILDLYPGNGCWSEQLKLTYEPTSHLLLEPRTAYRTYLTKKYPTFNLQSLDPYDWETYHKLSNFGFTPAKQNTDTIHSDLLVTANMTNPKMEVLFSQWLTCVPHKNWMFKYGRVPFLFWFPDNVTDKLLSKPGSSLRSKISATLSTFTYSKLIAKSESFPDEAFWPNKGKKAKVSCLLMIPKKFQIDYEIWDYVVKHLFMGKTTPLNLIASSLGHGAKEYFGDHLKNDPLWNKGAAEMSDEDFLRLTKLFIDWPFKPDVRADYLDVFSEHF